MKLSKIAILAIRGACPGIIQPLADALGVSKNTTYAYISENNDNLTKAASLEVIREHTGLTDDEILERETINAESGAK